MKPKFGPPSKASKTPASSKTVAPKSIQEEKVGLPSWVSKFSATEVDESDIDEVVVVILQRRSLPVSAKLSHCQKLPPPLHIRSHLPPSLTLPGDKVPLRNAKFFQHRSSSKRAPLDSEAEAMPHSSIIEAVVMEFGPSVVADHVER